MGVSLVAIALAAAVAVDSLTLPSLRRVHRAPGRHARRGVVRASLYEVTLNKPMGIIFEDNDEAAGGGLYVAELADGGAAESLGSIRPGDQLVTVAGTRATALDFDSAMGLLGEASAPVSLMFWRGSLSTIPAGIGSAVAPEEEEEEEERPSIGDTDDAPAPAGSTTAVTIRIVQDGGSDSIIVTESDAILRTVLLDNKVDVYNGMMDKAMNCGGAGQCGTCRYEVLEASEGCLGDRTPAEDSKLKNRDPSTRLACQTVLKAGGEIKIRTLVK